ncbi:hypothetical protein GCM10009574_002550 [Streptomyces asiaticus]
MALHLGGGVQLGAGVELHPQPAVARPVVDDDGQIVVVTDGQVVHHARVAAEVQVVVEHDDVDARADQTPAVGQRAGVAAQLLVAVALVAQGAAHPPGDLAQQLGDGVPRPDGQPQRHEVGHHAGHVRGVAAGPGRDREGEDDIGAAGDPVQIQRLGGDGHRRPGGARLAGQRPDRLDGGRLQRGDHPQQRAVRIAGGLCGEALGLGAVGQLLGPVPPVADDLLGPAVRGVGLDELPQTAVAGLRARLPRHGGRVHGGDPARDHAHALAVQCDVVMALVPDVPVLGEPEQREGEQRSGEEVHRALLVGRGPCAHGGLRIVLSGHVHEVERPVESGRHHLVRAVGVRAEGHPQGLGLIHHPPQGGLEQTGVDGALDVHPLRQAEERIGGIALDGVPDSPLAVGQAESNTLRDRHALTPHSMGERRRSAEQPSLVAACPTPVRCDNDSAKN